MHTIIIFHNTYGNWHFFTLIQSAWLHVYFLSMLFYLFSGNKPYHFIWRTAQVIQASQLSNLPSCSKLLECKNTTKNLLWLSPPQCLGQITWKMHTCIIWALENFTALSATKKKITQRAHKGLAQILTEKEITQNLRTFHTCSISITPIYIKKTKNSRNLRTIILMGIHHCHIYAPLTHQTIILNKTDLCKPALTPAIIRKTTVMVTLQNHQGWQRKWLIPSVPH